MGLKVEINSMLRLGKGDPDPASLKIGESYTICKGNLRIYLIDIPILLLAEDWTVQGYCVVTKTTASGEGMAIEFKLQSRFTPEEQQMYTKHLLAALKESGYL